MADDTLNFIAEREQRFGGEMTWRGFSVFYGDSDHNYREKGGLLFRIGTVFHFEDFKVKKTFLGIPVSTDDDSDYVRFESCFDAKDVEDVFFVTRRNALSFINGRTDEVRKVSEYRKIISEVVTCVRLKDNRKFFFQFGDRVFMKMVLSIAKNS